MNPLHLALTLASCVPTVTQATELKPNMTFSYFKNYNKEVVFLDLFDTKTLPKNQFAVAYIATTYERWRPDAKDFPIDIIGNPIKGWDKEFWTDYRSKKLREIILKRIMLAKEKGFNAVDFDNVDGHLNDSGFKLTKDDQLDFVKFLSEKVHARGMKIGLKNSAETASSLKPYFDFVVIEECEKYKECGKYSSFQIQFPIEYTAKSDALCKKHPNIVFGNKDLSKQEFCR